MANIFAQYLQPVRSVGERMADLDAQDYRSEQLSGSRQQNAIQALAMRRQMEADEQTRGDERLFSDLAARAPDRNALMAALEQSRNPRLLMKAQTIRKEDEDIAGKRATRVKAEVDADKDRLAMALSRADAIRQATSAATDQGSYTQALRGLHAVGIDISSVPQQFDPEFVRNAGLQALTMAQRAEQEWKAKGYDLESRKVASTERNDLILPGGAVNQPLLDAKQRVARAGASSVSINTGQKGLDNEFKLRGEFKQEPVYKAHQEMQAAHGQIKQAIAQASPAGDLAAATKIMKLLDPGSVVRESELGMAMQASGLMDRVTNYGNMVITGQKLTPTQRKDFQSLADRLMGESTKAYNSKRTEYDKLGSEYGLNAGRALGPTAPSGKADEFKILKVEEAKK